MTNTNATNFRKKAFEYFNQAIMFGDVINVNTKNGNAVVMSESDYNSMMETFYLLSHPKTTTEIKEAMNENWDDGKEYDPSEEW